MEEGKIKREKEEKKEGRKEGRKGEISTESQWTCGHEREGGVRRTQDPGWLCLPADDDVTLSVEGGMPAVWCPRMLL